MRVSPTSTDEEAVIASPFRPDALATQAGEAPPPAEELGEPEVPDEALTQYERPQLDRSESQGSPESASDRLGEDDVPVSALLDDDPDADPEGLLAGVADDLVGSAMLDPGPAPTVLDEGDPAGAQPLSELIVDVEQEPREDDEEEEEEQEQELLFPSDVLKAVFRKPTVGFEFDVHYGPIPALAPALNGTVVSSHSQAADGFEVKLDGRRLEVNTRPFECTDAGRQELTRTAGLIAKFALELQTGCQNAARVTVPGVSGSARPFTHPTMTVPIGKLPVGGRFTNCSVWAAPQATLTVRLENVARLVERIKSSEGDGPGRALTGGSTARMGLQSEALYRAYREVKRARRTIAFSDALEGFLILLASYLWAGELPYRYPVAGEAVNGARHDYEPFGKSYLPINVKTPLSQVFSVLLTATDQQAFRDRFADGSARVNLFRLARPSGATLADGDRRFLPGGREELGEPSVHRRQKAAFGGVVPTWNDLVDHTLDPTHRGWGTRLLVPLSKAVDVSKTAPRVLLELRRIGFAAVDRSRWTDFMLAMHKLTTDLNR